MLEQEFYHYEKWEDYRNGMFSFNCTSQEELVENGIKMLSNPILFYDTCIEILKNWPIATAVNLTNLHCNRRAWLGAAACSYKFRVPEIQTRIAWNHLTERQQGMANRIADMIIKHYESTYKTNKDAQIVLEF